MWWDKKPTLLNKGTMAWLFFYVFSKRTQKIAVWFTEITRECETVIFNESINTQRKLHILIREQMTHHIPDLLMNNSRIWITLTNLSLSEICSMCRRFVNEWMSSEWMNHLNRLGSRFSHGLLKSCCLGWFLAKSYQTKVATFWKPRAKVCWLKWIACSQLYYFCV